MWLEKEVERLRQQNTWLWRELEKVLRTAKRQAAPFSRQAPKQNPRPPGRKPGPGYGRAHWWPIPEQMDETLEAPLPARCPDCGGRVVIERVVEQYQTDLPPIGPQRVRFRIPVGRCRQCGRRLQGRYPRQSSDAGGVAASQLGPRTVAWAVWLVKGLGLPNAKAAAVWGEEYAGLLVHDGWNLYEQFTHASIKPAWHICCAAAGR